MLQLDKFQVKNITKTSQAFSCHWSSFNTGVSQTRLKTSPSHQSSSNSGVSQKIPRHYRRTGRFLSFLSAS